MSPDISHLTLWHVCSLPEEQRHTVQYYEYSMSVVYLKNRGTPYSTMNVVYLKNRGTPYTIMNIACLQFT